MKHYKIVIGFREDEYIPISGDELPKAWALFIEATGRGVFTHGGVRGQDIRMITPDWNAALGFNRGYRLTSDDYILVANIEKEYYRVQDKGKEIAMFALRNDRRDLLLLPASESIKELPAMPSLKKLAEKGRPELSTP